MTRLIRNAPQTEWAAARTLASDGSAPSRHWRRHHPARASGTRRQLLQAVRRQRDLEPRRRHRRHRLPLAGLCDHPQPAPDRAGRGRATAAVAAVLAPGGRDHRSPRPPPPDGRRERVASRHHPRRRGRRARTPGCAAGTRCRGRRRGDHLHRRCAVSAGVGRHVAARHVRGDLRQLGADVHAGHRPLRRSRTGERAPVEHRTGRQHLRRPTARSAADRRDVLAPVLRRRSDVRDLCGADLADPGGPTSNWGNHHRTAVHGRPSSPMGFAGSGATTCCAHSRSCSG